MALPVLPNALRDWNTVTFAQTLKREIEQLGSGGLPLQKAMTPGSYPGEQPITVTVLHTSDADEAIEARIGIFFTEVVASCGCGAEPMEQNAYCEMRVRLSKATAEASFEVAPD